VRRGPKSTTGVPPVPGEPGGSREVSGRRPGGRDVCPASRFRGKKDSTRSSPSGRTSPEPIGFGEASDRVADLPAQSLRLAEQVITAASRERPADAALRDTLRKVPDLSPADARAISRAVFSYYRWFGWLERHRPLAAQLHHALELAKAFAERPETFSDGKLVQRAVPSWLHDQLAVTPGWVRALQTEPRVWLRAKLGQGTALAGRLGRCRIPPAPALADAIEYRGDEDLFRSREFHAGEFEIQDVTSQAVGLVCDPHAGETWWDACAGEGGKTLHLSELMRNRGLIWASDRALWRLRQLKRRAARAGCFNYRTVSWDGGPKLPTKTRFDGVLVDAPCTGVGTWQRNPQARWTTTPGDVAELAALQLRLLTHAAVVVKPGGRLIYSVCTLTRAETEDVAQISSERFPEFEPVSVPNPWRAEKAGQGGGAGKSIEGSPAAEVGRASSHLWLWPQDTGGNGMFVAVWRRRPTRG
jgi:16S rRNA (cytosine967-C5)-methyltransferase